METTKSIEIIERMLAESKKSLYNNSFYFLLWGALLVPAGIAEYLLQGTPYFWLPWPVVGTIGGIISMIYSKRQEAKNGLGTAADRITMFTWGAFGFSLFFVIAFSAINNMLPHALILLIAGSATFISGGISRFKPFIWGGVVLEIGAMLCAFVIEPSYQSLAFSLFIFLGYVIPGVILRKEEHGNA
jgi:hypothetical protein